METEAVRQLAELPPDRRRSAAQKQGEAAADQGLTDFLLSLIDDDLVDDLAAILPGGTSQEAEDLLRLLWARLLLMISSEAKDVLYAHNQLRLMAEQRARRASSGRAPDVDGAYRSALDNARAVLSATEELESEEKVPDEL